MPASLLLSRRRPLWRWSHLLHVLATLLLQLLPLVELIRAQHALQLGQERGVVGLHLCLHLFRRRPRARGAEFLARRFVLRALFLEDALHFRLLRLVEVELLRDALERRATAWRSARRRRLRIGRVC